MVDTSRLDRVYGQLLKQHGGWAVFNKVDTIDLRPGSLGYFDSDGSWRTIINVAEDDLKSAGWSTLIRGVDVESNSGIITWGPKVSQDVRSFGLSLEAGAPIPTALGAEVSASFKVEGKSEKGAILVTEAPIQSYKVTDDMPLLQWVRNNAQRLVELHGEPLREHGLWIATKTYATRRCAISLLNSKSSVFEISLRLDLSGFATLGPKTELAMSKGDTSTVMYEDANGVVVFMCGIYITKRIFSRNLRVETRREKQEFLRSGEREDPYTVNVLESDGSDAVLEIELV